MAIKIAIFSAASVEIVDFDAAEKMTTKTSLKLILDPLNLASFSLIVCLTVRYFETAIAMVYSDGDGRRCRPSSSKSMACACIAIKC